MKTGLLLKSEGVLTPEERRAGFRVLEGGRATYRHPQEVVIHRRDGTTSARGLELVLGNLVKKFDPSPFVGLAVACMVSVGILFSPPMYVALATSNVWSRRQ